MRKNMIRAAAEGFLKENKVSDPKTAEEAAKAIRLRIEWLMVAVVQAEQLGVRTWVSIDSDEKNPQIKHYCNQRISQDI